MRKLGFPSGSGARPRRTMRLRRSERGEQSVEMALCCLPFFGLIFLILSIAYAVHAKATLQHAVAEGVRYAITSQTMPGMGQDASIKSVVQGASQGILTTAAADLDKIKIQYYSINSKTGDVTPTNSNLGGNLVEVSVENANIGPLAPILAWGAGRNSGDQQSLTFIVRASDRMEGSPGGVAPTR